MKTSQIRERPNQAEIKITDDPFNVLVGEINNPQFYSEELEVTKFKDSPGRVSIAVRAHNFEIDLSPEVFAAIVDFVNKH